LIQTTSNDCIEIDRVNICTGIVFEPLKDRKRSFSYTVFETSEGDAGETVAIFGDYRIILKGKNLDELPDLLASYQVRRIRALPESGAMLAGVGDGNPAIITGIKVEYLGDDRRAHL
jgi:hypothetical protein